VESNSQAVILSDTEARWTEALISEKYREQAKLLVHLLSQVMEKGGGIPEHHHGIIRAKMDSLSANLWRMTTDESIFVSRAVKLAGDALPDPAAGKAFHRPLSAAESAEIRKNYASPVLRPERAREDGYAESNGTGSHALNGNGNGKYADPEDSVISDEPDTEPWDPGVFEQEGPPEPGPLLDGFGYLSPLQGVTIFRIGGRESA